VANVSGRVAILLDDRMIDIQSASDGRFPSDPQAIFERWDEFREWAGRADLAGTVGAPLDERLIACAVPSPRQVFAIGLNYRAHAAEAEVEAPRHPPVFTKFPSSLAGAFDDVELPSETVDWEVELVAVMGRRAHRVSAGDAWDYVAGLTIGQDLSERTVQLRPPIPQFSLGKSFPRFSPVGPFIVTIDEFDDPDDLAISCQVGDEVLQAGRTSQMIFSVPRLIEELSAVATLFPGDLIFTGTPSGVGVARDPQRFLQPDDVLVSNIEGVGRMSNRMVVGAARADRAMV
jgi:2-keto-4-pentenoate hydratase/2-oxohepta-3-ene-1,7-dioic acid hydratase in catechol pathway